MKVDLNRSLTIDPEFESLCPALTEKEEAQLRSNLEEDGCRDPLVVWGCNGEELLVDGHNRYRLCQELGIGFKTVRMRFESRDKAKQWILTNQLGRRNLTDEQRTRLIGLLYKTNKRQDGGHGDQKSGCQNDTPKTRGGLASSSASAQLRSPGLSSSPKP